MNAQATARISCCEYPFDGGVEGERAHLYRTDGKSLRTDIHVRVMLDETRVEDPARLYLVLGTSRYICNP
jgi:hypothetical protein